MLGIQVNASCILSYVIGEDIILRSIQHHQRDVLSTLLEFFMLVILKVMSQGEVRGILIWIMIFTL